MDEIIEITIFQSQKISTRRDYSDEKLQECLKEIRSGRLSCNKASKDYDIPRTTLVSKLLGRRPEGKRKRGPEPTLGE